MTIYDKFKKYNNRIVDIYRTVKNIDSIGNTNQSYSLLYPQVSCLIWRQRDKPYGKTMGNTVEYTKSTHTVRLPLEYELQIDDKIIEWSDDYIVKYIDPVPTFSGWIDHFVYFLEKLEKWVQ